ncbi:hypothetical protein HRG_002547 [Hirsutella rhossiliensis]|uniref:Uncharacterized protein n=1 Tax=Hirsutella rhossiliensis TaxID=111463 RepID=A0A9P8N3T9_9HYPO|nr:uncharacterized protein HRG_02547 [Hirsutella rhossiliensis]KAH0967138.1 hypothetical protein HRG_02547 [Hirsutella rhossiliensis]
MGSVLDPSQEAFEQPQLRRCQFNLSQVDWERAVRIGGGLDGYVWKVHFGSEGPYALKVFYDTFPPNVHYYAFERECRNAALLQLMQAAVRQAAAESASIVVNSKPATIDDIRNNLLAFSNERRLMSPAIVGESDEVVSEIPPFTECYGWLQFSGQTFLEMPFKQTPPTYKADKLIRLFAPDRTYFAIVYEYIADPENNDQVVEKVDRFLHRAGFGHTMSPDGSNWRHSKLIDHSEYVDYRGAYPPAPVEVTPLK